MPLPYILGRGCCNPLSTIFVDSPFLPIYLTVTTSPDYTKVSVNLYFTFSQTHKLGYKPALLTFDTGLLSNFQQCAINSTECLQVSPSLGGTMLIAACHTDRVSNISNGRLDLLTAHVDKQTRFLPSLSDIFPNSPVFVHKHKLPALTQNIGKKMSARRAARGRRHSPTLLTLPITPPIIFLNHNICISKFWQ